MTIIRPAMLADICSLAELKRRTFRETFLEDFAVPYPPRDIARFEAETYSPEQVENELRDKDHVSWVVEQNETLVGYGHIGPCKLPHAEVQADDREIYQFYLLRSVQALGLGRQLMDVVMQAFEPADSIWLGAWSGNQRAQRFYSSYGFAKVGEYKFKVGDWYDHEFIFRKVGQTDRRA